MTSYFNDDYDYTLSYEEQLKTLQWQAKRRWILSRDAYRCQVCLSRKNLQVHHMYYTSGKMAWQYPDSALVTLCDACHENEHKKQQDRLKPSRLDEALERLINVAAGVREWCEKQFPKEDGEKTL